MNRPPQNFYLLCFSGFRFLRTVHMRVQTRIVFDVRTEGLRSTSAVAKLTGNLSLVCSSLISQYI